MWLALHYAHLFDTLSMCFIVATVARNRSGTPIEGCDIPMLRRTLLNRIAWCEVDPATTTTNTQHIVGCRKKKLESTRYRVRPW